MGLDAVVYMSRTRIEALLGVTVSACDELTGEVVSVADGEFRQRRATIACEEWIGNIALVADLRSLVATLLPPDSIVMSRVLYSGSHCGDVIEVSRMEELRRELETLARTREPAVRTFAAQMERLAIASLAEGNPIVF